MHRRKHLVRLEGERAIGRFLVRFPRYGLVRESLRCGGAWLCGFLRIGAGL
jgi:hypothetical protein